MTIKLEIPEAFQELLVLGKWRYKVFYGGRGGAKSHNFARALLILAMQDKLRILCARELQNSISDSVHKLLADIIKDDKGLSRFFKVLEQTIRGKNGSEFIFKGIKRNLTDIKSTEGVDICWVEEAEKTSATSWEILRPTIRQENSEIWVSFNTKSTTDPTYKLFVAEKDDDTLLRKVSWRDNPFFPDVLDKERRKLKQRDPLAYAHVWEGEPDKRHDGAVYAQLIDKAHEQERVCVVPYKPTVPVVTAWDLGKRHATCVWFAQVVGREVRIIDYYEAMGEDADIDALAKVVKAKEYLYDMHWLPHDARHERLGMKGSISDQLKKAGLRNRILPSIKESAGIEKAKALLREAYFDRHKTRDGLHAMSHFHYQFDELRQCFKDEPYDDWSKDSADAFRYLAIALDQRTPETAQRPMYQSFTQQQSWSVI